jgi:hypothetical protein
MSHFEALLDWCALQQVLDAVRLQYTAVTQRDKASLCWCYQCLQMCWPCKLVTCAEALTVKGCFVEIAPGRDNERLIAQSIFNTSSVALGRHQQLLQEQPLALTLMAWTCPLPCPPPPRANINAITCDEALSPVPGSPWKWMSFTTTLSAHAALAAAACCASCSS